MIFANAISHMPLIAIVRGVRPAEAESVCEALIEAGVTAVETPLNSPEPFKSIEIMARAFGQKAAIGAGTVLSRDEAISVKNAGGSFCVAPNTNAEVIRTALEEGMTPLPGFSTPTEAFNAIAAGAKHLKLFPAEAYKPSYLKALCAVLPKNVAVYPVGGVSDENMKDWITVGASGFGLGSSLYKPGMSVSEIRKSAAKTVSAYKNCIN